ncbi:hypothetical protein D3C76_918980 [compost metagenome]
MHLSDTAKRACGMTLTTMACPIGTEFTWPQGSAPVHITATCFSPQAFLVARIGVACSYQGNPLVPSSWMTSPWKQ